MRCAVPCRCRKSGDCWVRGLDPSFGCVCFPVPGVTRDLGIQSFLSDDILGLHTGQSTKRRPLRRFDWQRRATCRTTSLRVRINAHQALRHSHSGMVRSTHRTAPCVQTRTPDQTLASGMENCADRREQSELARSERRLAKLALLETPDRVRGLVAAATGDQA